MKIVIDATPLLLQSAGVKGHLHHWIRATRAAAPPGTIHTWPALRDLGNLDHSRSQASRFDTWLGVGSFLATHRLGLPAYDLLLPDADLFHACILQSRLPRKLRVTATVFDVTPLVTPEHHTEANVRSFNAHAGHVLKRAHALIAVSEYSRLDAIRALDLDPGRIVTVPSIIDDAYFQVTEQQAAAARAAYGLQKPFVLFVGTIEPRKNIDRLLDAWDALPAGHREEFDLVFAGSAGWRSDRTIARLRSYSSGVRWFGYVPEQDLPGLTRAARLLAYPSLYEGFGLPAGQALAAGVPVLSANVSSLPEVIGPGGLLVDPKSTSELGAALLRLLDDADLCARLAAEGREHVRARFQAHIVGEATVRFLEWACGLSDPVSPSRRSS